MMHFVPQLSANRPLRLLCLGAHSDDLEIGCGGAVLSWLAGPRPVEVTWVVFSAAGMREREALGSARALLRRARHRQVLTYAFRDGFFPAQHVQLKESFESIKGIADPDLVLTHRLEDRHQDHRIVAELTWNTFRNHAILEYEIPKYDGDLGQPNVYVPLTRRRCSQKAAHIVRHFDSQRSKYWFSPENFAALARLRGLECRAPDGYAEGFTARKLVMPTIG